MADVAKSLASITIVANAADDAELVYGWGPQLWVDLVFIHGVGIVGDHVLTKSRLDRSCRDFVKILVDNSSKMSARVRCYQKSINGSVVGQPSKQVWNAMQEIAASHASSVICEATPDEVRAWLGVLEDAKNSGDECGIANALTDVCDGADAASIANLAVYVGCHDESDMVDSGQKDLFDLARQLYSTIVGLLTAMLVNRKYHEDILTDHVKAAPEKSLECAGDIEVAAIIYDDAFFSDPSNLPDDVALLMLTMEVGSLLVKFAAEKNNCLLRWWRVVGRM
jgi:hypothetical protein